MLPLVYRQGLLAQCCGVVEDYGFNGQGEVFLVKSQAAIGQLQVLQREGTYGGQEPLTVTVAAVLLAGEIQRIPPVLVEVVIRTIERIAVPVRAGFYRYPDWRVSGAVQGIPSTAAIQAIEVGDRVILYIQTNQTTGQPKNWYLVRDRTTLPLVSLWTGVEIRLLRTAMRKSTRAFAKYIGVGNRIISKWEAGAIPRPYYQQLLDSCLVTADYDAQRRFELALREAVSATLG